MERMETSYNVRKTTGWEGSLLCGIEISSEEAREEIISKYGERKYSIINEDVTNKYELLMTLCVSRSRLRKDRCRICKYNYNNYGRDRFIECVVCYKCRCVQLEEYARNEYMYESFMSTSIDVAAEYPNGCGNEWSAMLNPNLKMRKIRHDIDYTMHAGCYKNGVSIYNELLKLNGEVASYISCVPRDILMYIIYYVIIGRDYVFDRELIDHLNNKEHEMCVLPLFRLEAYTHPFDQVAINNQVTIKIEENNYVVISLRDLQYEIEYKYYRVSEPPLHVNNNIINKNAEYDDHVFEEEGYNSDCGIVTHKVFIDEREVGIVNMYV